MKRILIVFLSISLLTACNNSPLVKKDKTEKEDRDKGDEDEDDDGDYKKKKKYEEDEDEDYTKKKKHEEDEDDDKDNGGWTIATREKYIDECAGAAMKKISRSQAQSYCECMQEKIEKKYEMTLAEANNATTMQEKLEEPAVKADVVKCRDN